MLINDMIETIERIVKGIEFTRKEKRTEQKQRKLKKFFESQKGKNYLKEKMDVLGLRNYRGAILNGGVSAIDDWLREYRYVVIVSSDDFLKFVGSVRPKELKYRVINPMDISNNGELLYIVDDMIAVRTSGILEYLVGQQPEGFLDKVLNIYRRKPLTEKPSDIDPLFAWRELTVREDE